MTLEQMAREFHEAAGLTLPPGPTLNIGAQFVSDEVRQKILDEEVQELRDAVAAGDLVQIADALADIAYVVAGTAVTYGLPFDAIMTEVHRSNMSKFGPDGPKVRGDGKIIKGPGYEPPQIAALIVSVLSLSARPAIPATRMTTGADARTPGTKRPGSRLSSEDPVPEFPVPPEAAVEATAQKIGNAMITRRSPQEIAVAIWPVIAAAERERILALLDAWTCPCGEDNCSAYDTRDQIAALIGDPGA